MRLDHNIYISQLHSRYVIVTIYARYFGGDSEEVTPVPIPNTEVKLFCADGTAWATVWESREPPESINWPPS